MSAKEMAMFLREMATKVRMGVIKKAPTKPAKGSMTKKNKNKPAFDSTKPHVATSRLLAAKDVC